MKTKKKYTDLIISKDIFGQYIYEAKGITTTQSINPDIWQVIKELETKYKLNFKITIKH